MLCQFFPVTIRNYCRCLAQPTNLYFSYYNIISEFSYINLASHPLSLYIFWHNKIEIYILIAQMLQKFIWWRACALANQKHRNKIASSLTELSSCTFRAWRKLTLQEKCNRFYEKCYLRGGFEIWKKAIVLRKKVTLNSDLV